MARRTDHREGTEHDRPERTEPAGRPGDHGPYLGYVVRLFPDKGFGFITRLCDVGSPIPATINEAIAANGGKPLQEAFLHHTALEPGTFDRLERGMVLSYHVRQTDKGSRAVRATVVPELNGYGE
jgi:cold shock CspA family protein